FAIAPSVYSNHLLLFNFMVFLMLAQGVNVIYGFTGYLPFGYVGFFGAGAYGFSLMVMHLHAPPLVALAIGAAAAVALGLLLTPLFRLSGAYFSIANLAAALAVLQVVSNPNLESITKGPYGVSLSGVFDPTFAYATALTILAATVFLVIYLRNSRFGMALQAIREDSISASMAGINVVRERIIAWLLSALIAGLAGGVFAVRLRVLSRDGIQRRVHDLRHRVRAVRRHRNRARADLRRADPVRHLQRGGYFHPAIFPADLRRA